MLTNDHFSSSLKLLHSSFPSSALGFPLGHRTCHIVGLENIHTRYYTGAYAYLNKTIGKEEKKRKRKNSLIKTLMNRPFYASPCYVFTVTIIPAERRQDVTCHFITEAVQNHAHPYTTKVLCILKKAYRKNDAVLRCESSSHKSPRMMIMMKKNVYHNPREAGTRSHRWLIWSPLRPDRFTLSVYLCVHGSHVCLSGRVVTAISSSEFISRATRRLFRVVSVVCYFLSHIPR